MDKFIGEEKIISQKLDKKENIVTFTFEKGKTYSVHADLAKGLISNEKTVFNPQTIVCTVIAKKFLKDLEDWNIHLGFFEGITTHLTNHVENDFQDASEKLWGDKYKQQVTIKDINAILKT